MLSREQIEVEKKDTLAVIAEDGADAVIVAEVNFYLSLLDQAASACPPPASASPKDAMWLNEKLQPYVGILGLRLDQDDLVGAKEAWHRLHVVWGQAMAERLSAARAPQKETTRES